ncbi:hypothetical protein AAGF08_11210 [Algoriphagus sp. SE2]|uniref:hypothetical protein n=1 Tax=Algoriphagus sp. SE2 TaxID=3141536 RepID=UPI0031CD20E7
MKRLTFLFFAFVICFNSKSQTGLLTQAHGARSQSMGNLKVNLQDAWTIFNNIGTLDRIEDSHIVLGVENRYGLKELSTFDLAVALKTELGSFGFNLSRFGGKLFNQQMLGIGYSQKLGIASFGLKADWFQTQIQDFGTGNSLVLSIGGVADLGPKIQLGAYFSNLNNSKISRYSEDRLPTLISMGISYFPVSSLQFHLEVEKDILLKPNVKLGLEYGIRDWFFLRTGINSNPSKVNFGFGVTPGKFHFDYGFGQNNVLGSTHQISFGYKWN